MNSHVDYYANEAEAVSAGLQKMSMSEIHEETTRLLKEFDRLCNENGWLYSLGYGTLLGAVRHGGPIPWDDDVDVLVPRFVFEEMVNTLPHGMFCEFMDPYSADYPWAYGKFVSTRTVSFGSTVKRPRGYGVFIDVFPVDGFPKRFYRVWYRLCKAAYGLMWSNFTDMDLKGNASIVNKAKWIFKRVAGFIITPELNKCFIKSLATIIPLDHAYSAGNLFSPYPVEKEVIPADSFSYLTRIPYDGIDLSVFSNYEEHLVRLYGDRWRTPVIVPQHGNAYWR